MHKAARFLLATPLVLLLTSCWDVVPGDVIFHPDSSTVTGSFTLKNATRLSTGTSTGGACLIYLSDRAAQKTCSTDANCTIYNPAPTEPTGTTGTTPITQPTPITKLPDEIPGYCADLNNNVTLGKTVKRACWYKPKPESCFRSGAASLPLNETLQLPPVSAYPLQGQRPIYWRVVTCQSMVSGGCASGIPANRLYRYGKIATVN